MGNLRQLDDKFGLKNVNTDAVATATVFNIQIAGEPTHADRFFLTPYCYRFVSAGGSAWEEDSAIDRPSFKQGVYGTRYITLGGNVSATASAVSAEINLACAGSEGTTAATAAGSTTDIAATATIPGNKIECYEVRQGTAADIVITTTTAGTAGKSLPEGYTTYTTSAGNALYAADPGEATFMRESGRHPSQKV